MKVGTLVRVIAEVLPILERNGLIDANDDFHDPTPEQWATVASEVEAVLKAHGVTVQENVDKVIQILPLVLSMAGVK